MATRTPQQPDTSDSASAASRSNTLQSIHTGPQTPPDEGKKWPLRVVVLVIMLVLGFFGWGRYRALGNLANSKVASTMTAPVKRGDLLVTVVEDGNLESASNIDIKCEVAGGTSILWIVDDGTEVKKGDKIVELDAAALEESINQQRITFEKARAAKIQAEKNFAVAKLAVAEYLQGTYVQAVQDQDAQITIAEENLRSAQNSLDHSKRMFRKGYISSLDLESQTFSVQRAQLELDSARTAKEVLVKFTKLKTVQELESARDTAEAQMRSEGASFDLEESRLKRLEAQLEKCIIIAPASGMVVYANEQGGRFGGSQSPQIEEGAMVRERQTILRLPDLAQMQVKVNVHESKIEMLGRAMKRAANEGNELPAQVRILARRLQGSLTSIANQPEPSGWWTGNIKEYATIISIDGTPQGLRPGMTAECEILIDHRKDVLTVPVAAVVEQRGGYFAWIKQDNQFKKRPLVLGETNDQHVEVKDGLVESMEVVLNPRAVIPEARAVKEAVEDKDAAKKFGKGGKVAPNGHQGKGPAKGKSGGKMGGGKKGGGDKGAGQGKRRSMSISQMDKDGDGKLSKEELPAPMQGYFDMLDANKDGFVDAGEMAKARQRRGKQGSGGPPR